MQSSASSRNDLGHFVDAADSIRSTFRPNPGITLSNVRSFLEMADSAVCSRISSMIIIPKEKVSTDVSKGMHRIISGAM